jgi:hypothetical protein
MYAVAPSIAESFNLLWLASNMVSVAILHVAARRRPLKIAVEFDPVRRIEVDALDLTP